ncbi:hypothetical protein [Gimesia aquarii]|uniref:NfeD-like C-terminal domain-containing protein n=1 Tax=Gimesia aquarii TaxID=2527964 RepID=A0A517VTC7_9PLAN|nr:hypothetical protein [Gimesia aquarii]QDT96267.1 hypothetical protein V144x_17210 [Gimesia aquarii]
MYSFSPWIDIPLAAFSYGVTLFCILNWVHKSDQQEVKKTRETTQRAVFRLAIVVLSLVLICYAFDIALWLVATIVAALVLGVSSGEMLGVLGIPFIGLGYLIKEYVLGFPEAVLTPPVPLEQSTQTVDPLNQYVGRTTIAKSSLRPQGTVEIDGLQLDAMSASGMMISQGTALCVTGTRDGCLLVCEPSESANNLIHQTGGPVTS